MRWASPRTESPHLAWTFNARTASDKRAGYIDSVGLLIDRAISTAQGEASIPWCNVIIFYQKLLVERLTDFQNVSILNLYGSDGFGMGITEIDGPPVGAVVPSIV